MPSKFNVAKVTKKKENPQIRNCELGDSDELSKGHAYFTTIFLPLMMFKPFWRPFRR